MKLALAGNNGAAPRENLSSDVPTRSDTNRAVQPQKIVRCWNFRIFGRRMIELSLYLCSENKGADQLCGYRTADQRLCFCIYANKSGFSVMRLNGTGETVYQAVMHSRIHSPSRQSIR